MDFAAALAEIKNAGLYRSFKTLDTAQGREVVIDGKKTLLFSSNSYLGLANEPDIVRKSSQALKKYGAGAGGSRLTTGNLTPHMDLESRLAAFKGTRSCLVFAAGYMANLGAITALSHKDSVIFSDALNHASIIDGCRLSRARTVVYRHNDLDDLVSKIRDVRPPKGLIVTDGVFSMDGDMAKLPELAQIRKEHGLLLMVDDAHATGALGRSGRGSLEHFGLDSHAVDVVMGTLSKAIPSEGGFICGSGELCDYLKNTARTFIYTTALSPAAAAAAAAGVEHIQNHPQRVRRLQDNALYFATRLRELGLDACEETPIFPVIIGEEAAAGRISEELFRRGIFVPCIRYPTVAKGKARLRFTLMATHTRHDMDYAISCLKDVLPDAGAFNP